MDPDNRPENGPHEPGEPIHAAGEPFLQHRVRRGGRRDDAAEESGADEVGSHAEKGHEIEAAREGGSGAKRCAGFGRGGGGHEHEAARSEAGTARKKALVVALCVANWGVGVVLLQQCQLFGRSSCRLVPSCTRRSGKKLALCRNEEERKKRVGAEILTVEVRTCTYVHSREQEQACGPSCLRLFIPHWYTRAKNPY